MRKIKAGWYPEKEPGEPEKVLQKEDSGNVGAKVQGGGPLKGRAGPQYETSLKGWVRQCRECPFALTAERFLINQPVGKIEKEAGHFSKVPTVWTVPFTLDGISFYTLGGEVTPRKPGPSG